MAEGEFLREKIKSLQREKDQLQLQLSKARSAQNTYVPPSQYPSQFQLENEQLKLDVMRLSAALAAKTALVSSLQESLRRLELEHEKIKEDVAIASLSMELDIGNYFDDSVGRAVRTSLLDDAPAEFRDLLLFNDPKILGELKKYLNGDFLPRLVSLLPYIHSSCSEILRSLLPDLRVGLDCRHLRVLRALIEVDAISDPDELWSVLTRVAEVIKRPTAPTAELFLLAAVVVRPLDAAHLKRLQKELSDLILTASHSDEFPALSFLHSVAARSPDILGFAALRCNANCLNVAQRLLQFAVNGVYALRPMSVDRTKMIIKILAKIAAVRAERGSGRALDLQLSTVNSSSEGKVALFRPPPVFGHLIDFVSALVEALNFRPIYRNAVLLRSDAKLLHAFYLSHS